MATDDSPLNILAQRGLALALGQAQPPASGALIFSEDFSAIPDTVATEGLTADLAANGWTATRSSGDDNGPHFTPAQGFTSNHHIWEIQGDADKARTAGGRSVAFYRESYTLPVSQVAGWNSDAVLYIDFPQDYSELYVEFYVKFQPGWTLAGQSKLFRALHWDRTGGRFDFFSDGQSCPIQLWDYAHSDLYGLRNFLAFRGDPQGTNYYFVNQPIPNLPRQMTQGDISCNFQEDIRDLNGNGVDDNPITLTDLLTGATLDTTQKVVHDQVYGTEWVKVGFYYKMNSAPGVEDGVFKQWIRDQLVFSNTTMPWLSTGAPAGIGWNAVAFGGNDNWNTYSNDQAVQEWYAMTDIKVYDGLPGGMV